MSEFEDFFKDLQGLVDSYTKKGVMLKVDGDLDNTIVKIVGEKMTSVSKAKNGLEDVTELAYTTAEHHPYWGLLYNACQISNTALEKWNGSLTKEELDEISWNVSELKNVQEKLSSKDGSENNH